jgi:hypothetical protein
MEPVVGFEPTTDGLQNRCSTTELNWLKLCNINDFELLNSCKNCEIACQSSIKSKQLKTIKPLRRIYPRVRRTVKAGNTYYKACRVVFKTGLFCS